MTELTGQVGFASPISDSTFAKRRRAGVELFATLALAISLVIAATAISIGARAQVFSVVSGAGRGASPLVSAIRL